jgi:hypothetical protein
MDKHGLDAWITPGATGPAPAGYQSYGKPCYAAAMDMQWTADAEFEKRDRRI